jgi:hypothetical protein
VCLAARTDQVNPGSPGQTLRRHPAHIPSRDGDRVAGRGAATGQLGAVEVTIAAATGPTELREIARTWGIEFWADVV